VKKIVDGMMTDGMMTDATMTGAKMTDAMTEEEIVRTAVNAITAKVTAMFPVTARSLVRPERVEVISSVTTAREWGTYLETALSQERNEDHPEAEEEEEEEEEGNATAFRFW